MYTVILNLLLLLLLTFQYLFHMSLEENVLIWIYSLTGLIVICIFHMLLSVIALVGTACEVAPIKSTLSLNNKFDNWHHMNCTIRPTKHVTWYFLSHDLMLIAPSETPVIALCLYSSCSIPSQNCLFVEYAQPYSIATNHMFLLFMNYMIAQSSFF